MAERLVLAGIIVAVGVVVWCAFNCWSVRRVRQVANVDPALASARRGVPTVVYFTTPQCIPCRTLQQPALAELQQNLGEQVQVVRIDATEQPDVADRWGVFSAPTTFVLDSTQTPRHVNRGVATVETLRKQLASVV